LITGLARQDQTKEDQMPGVCLIKNFWLSKFIAMLRLCGLEVPKDPSTIDLNKNPIRKGEFTGF